MINDPPANLCLLSLCAPDCVLKYGNHYTECNAMWSRFSLYTRVDSWIQGITRPVPYTRLHRFRCQLSGSAQSRAEGFCAESPLRTGPADPCCRTGGFTTLMTQIQFHNRPAVHIPLKNNRNQNNMRLIPAHLSLNRQTDRQQHRQIDKLDRQMLNLVCETAEAIYGQNKNKLKSFYKDISNKQNY